MESCIDKWCGKYNLSKATFQDWKGSVTAKIDERIASLRPNNRKQHHPILNNDTSKDCLDSLKSKFVLVPIDKASNNIAFICKRFYAQVLLEELGLIGASTSTYTKIDDRLPNDIIQQHTAELKTEI